MMCGTVMTYRHEGWVDAYMHGCIDAWMDRCFLQLASLAQLLPMQLFTQTRT